MADSFVLSGRIDLVDNATDGLNKVSNNVDKTGKSVEDAESKMSKFANGLSKAGGKLTAFATVPIVGLATVTANLANSLEETQRKSKIVFGDMTADVQSWALENERNFGLGAGTIEGFVSQIADVTQGLGMAKDVSLEFSKGVLDTGTKLANWGGVGTEEAINDIQSAMLGATKSVEKYGIKLTESVLDQYAMNAGYEDGFKNLTEVEKAQVRYNAILGSSQNAVDYWNEGNRSATFTMQEMKEQLSNVGENLGKVFLPYLLEGAKKVADLCAKLATFTSENPKLAKMIVIIAGIVASIGPVLLVLAKVISIVKAIKTAYVAVKGAMVALQIATKAQAVAQGILNAVMAMNPIGLIIIGIMALIVAIMYLWQNCEWFRDLVLGAWEILKNAFNGYVEYVKTMWTAFVNILKAVWQGIVDYFNFCLNMWKTVFTTVVNFITNCWDAGTSLIRGAWETLSSGIINIFDNVKNTVVGIAQSIVNTIIRAVNFCINSLNKLSFKVPKWVPEIGGMEFGLNIPNVNEVSWLYEGGIFNKPTVLSGGFGVGDAYKGQGRQTEAVMPIDKLRGMIADLLQVDITLEIDGNSFVRKVVAPHQQELSNYSKLYNY